MPRTSLPASGSLIAMQSTRSTRDGRDQVLVDLVASARPQDVRRSGDDVVQGIRRGAELAVDQGDGEAVESTATQFGGHVRGVQPGIDGTLLDLLHQFRRHLTQLLDLLLVGEQLSFGERTNRVDDHLVLVGKCEVQGLLRVRSAVVVWRRQ